MQNLTNKELSDRLKKLRRDLKFVINSETNVLLRDIERRLLGDPIDLPIRSIKKIRNKKPTKAELYAKFNNKGQNTIDLPGRSVKKIRDKKPTKAELYAKFNNKGQS